MKAIDVNKRCCTCKYETDKCVKMSTKEGLDICFDTNEMSVDEETSKVILKLEEEKNWFRKHYYILWASVIVTIILLAIWECCK